MWDLEKQMKKALVFEPQYTDRRIDVSCVPASNPFSWFFPCKSIGPQYHHQLHDLRFLRAVGFHRCVHKSHSKNLSQFRFSCKPSRVHQTANLDCHVSECFLKHWTPSSLDCICIRSNLCSKHYVLLILLVTMCSWFHYDSYSGAVQTNCWSLFLCCTEQWLLWPSASKWKLAASSYQADSGCFLLLIVELIPSKYFESSLIVHDWKFVHFFSNECFCSFFLETLY